MPTHYNLVTTQSSIQVVSPTTVLDIVVATIQTKPHGVMFDYWLAKADFDEGTAPIILDAVAAGVEQIMSGQPVIAAVGSPQLDRSGLQAEIITFTVAYKTPGSVFPPATVDVDVPASDFGQDTLNGHNAGLEDATRKIQSAYAKLKAAAGGTATSAAG